MPERPKLLTVFEKSRGGAAKRPGPKENRVLLHVFYGFLCISDKFLHVPHMYAPPARAIKKTDPPAPRVFKPNPPRPTARLVPPRITDFLLHGGA